MGRIGRFIWRSSLFPRKLSFTREGRIVVGMSIGLGLAAVNTGNNLLYLVFGISLSLIIVSGLLSEGNLRGIACGPLPFDRATARVPLHATLRVNVRRRRFPAFAIEAWPLIEPEGCVVVPARFLDLKASGDAEGTCRIEFPRRGEYRLKGMVVSTGFPFSFFRKSVVFPADQILLVHPVVAPANGTTSGAAPGIEEEPSGRAGAGIEFLGVRDFREGDNPKHVLHRLSAARSVPVVRELEATGTRRVWIALVNVEPGGDGEDRVEDAIERAAGIAVDRIRKGDRVGLASATGALPPAPGSMQAKAILDFLAILPVVWMQDPGVDDVVRESMGGDRDAEVVWVRP